MTSLLTRHLRRHIIMVIALGGLCCGATTATAINISISPSSPAVGATVTFTATGCPDCTDYWWEFDRIGDTSYSDGGSGYALKKKFPLPDTYWARVTGDTGASQNKQFTVIANNFTVNIIPSAGCAVIAGDGGVDEAVEADGIACAGGMAADNPLCTEQFKNSDVAALKVVPDPGYEFVYWEMNGGIIQQASAEPLFLSTMPLFAGLVVVPTSRVATMTARCLSVTLQSVAFAGMPADVVKDDGTPYRATPDAPHWQKTDDPSYRPAPVVFAAGSPITVTATFAVEPADFAGDLYITGTGTDAQHPSHLVALNPQKATLTNGIASVTISAATKKQVDMFDKMRIDWAYGFAKNGQFKQVTGVSEHQLYITLAAPLTSPVYHTLAHLGCLNASGEIAASPSTLPSGEEKRGAIAAIWEEFQNLEVMRISADEPMKYYGSYSSSNIEPLPDEFFTTAGLLKNGDGRCSAWANLFVDLLRTQGIASGVVKEILPKETPELGEIVGFSMRSLPLLLGQGQGQNVPLHAGPFPSHAVVMLDNASHIYDPSYGRDYSNLMRWEDFTVETFIFLKNGNQLIVPNTLGDEQTEIR